MDFYDTTNWAYFINGLTSILNDDDYEDKFPKFVLEIEECSYLDIFVENCIFAGVKKKENIAYMFTTFIKTILKGRKSSDFLDYFRKSIIFFIDYIDDKFLMEILFEPNEGDTLDEIFYNYEIRGKIIDMFIEHDPKYRDLFEKHSKEKINLSWKEIDAKSPKQIEEEEYIDDVSELSIFSVIKFYSVNLKD